MKIIILAAGKGVRLGEADAPKPLTKLINGKTILASQLENISKFFSLQDVIVVVGYHKEQIMEAFPDLLYVYNPLFAEENTAKSLLRALQKIEDDVLWLNGDVVFHHSILKDIPLDQSFMIVNEGPVGEEEVKYRLNPDNFINEISKNVKAPLGEALGINFFKKSDLPSLKQSLLKCNIRDYFEKGIELSIQQGTGVKVRAVKVNPELCTEIDFPEDLVHANKLLASWAE